MPDDLTARVDAALARLRTRDAAAEQEAAEAWTREREALAAAYRQRRALAAKIQPPPSPNLDGRPELRMR
jgi:hypothetical protein